jgi:membrane-bound lytic murein transglycosylase B
VSKLSSTIAVFLIAALTHTTSGAEPNKQKKRHKTARPAATSTAAAGGALYATRTEALQAADDIARQLGLEPEWVRQAVGSARFMPSIAKAASPPAVGTPKNWTVYRSRFIDTVRIQAGVKFWQANRDTLERAEQATGVPAQIIVGIIGVETIYGQQTGNFRVIDALCTLAFDFPTNHPKAAARAAFFRSELQAYLALTHRTKTDPLALRGSYAGAMGLPQFMPSSWNQYAVDFDGDGRIDLFHSAADVIGSVANYFKAFNWQRGLPTHYSVTVPSNPMEKAILLAPDIVPSFTPKEFVERGAELDADGQRHPGLLALVELQNGDAPGIYLAGTENFYAITRYNWSSYYALSVIELGEKVAAAMPK